MARRPPRSRLRVSVPRGPARPDSPPRPSPSFARSPAPRRRERVSAGRGSRRRADRRASTGRRKRPAAPPAPRRQPVGEAKRRRVLGGRLAVRAEPPPPAGRGRRDGAAPPRRRRPPRRGVRAVRGRARRAGGARARPARALERAPAARCDRVLDRGARQLVPEGDGVAVTRCSIPDARHASSARLGARERSSSHGSTCAPHDGGRLERRPRSRRAGGPPVRARRPGRSAAAAPAGGRAPPSRRTGCRRSGGAAPRRPRRAERRGSNRVQRAARSRSRATAATCELPQHEAQRVRALDLVVPVGREHERAGGIDRRPRNLSASSVAWSAQWTSSRTTTLGPPSSRRHASATSRGSARAARRRQGRRRAGRRGRQRARMASPPSGCRTSPGRRARGVLVRIF